MQVVLRGVMRYLLLMVVSLMPWQLRATPPVFTFYTEHLPPYSYLEHDELKGINVELVQLLCQQLQLQCHLQLLPWARAFDLAQRDSYSGVFSTARSQQREALFQWVGPLASDWGYLYRLSSRPQVAPTSLQEAKHFSVAVVRGDVYEQYFRQHGFNYKENLLDFTTRSETIPLFLQGRIDLIPASPLAIGRWLAEYDAPADSAVAVFKLIDVGDNYLALHRDMPAEVVAQLQLTLLQFKQSDDYKLLLQRYLTPQHAQLLLDGS